MIERYTRPEMASLWSDEAKYSFWLKVELAVCEAFGKRGEIPREALETIRKQAGFDVTRIATIEKEVRHDVIAFLTSVAEQVGPASRFIHLGLTSSDVVDTAFALQLKQASDLLDRAFDHLLKVLRQQAVAHKQTMMIGRTHGMHAEPITFGLKVATWYDECRRQRERLQQATTDIAVGKLSGAVGTYAHLPPDLEQEVCTTLGLTPATTATQVIPRDRHAHFFSALAGVATSVEHIAVEIRHLMRSEVGEVAEGFGKGQKGSSAMPHKRNPILSENITGLARLVRSYATAAFENVPLWHERDISHSSVERVIGPDATTLVDFMLHRLANIIENLEVFPERMKSNLEASRGLFASQSLLLELVRSGMTREEAYRVVQACAMKASKEGRFFRELVEGEREITSRLSTSVIERSFQLGHHLRNVDLIFERVFGM
ncbi:MAG: adenylosuccinate lyase [Deltaproteobacteria bacterium]|nr:adenylosuccinate lyase [Deltaproteobacteria bacterium]